MNRLCSYVFLDITSNTESIELCFLDLGISCSQHRTRECHITPIPKTSFPAHAYTRPYPKRPRSKIRNINIGQHHHHRLAALPTSLSLPPNPTHPRQTLRSPTTAQVPQIQRPQSPHANSLSASEGIPEETAPPLSMSIAIVEAAVEESACKGASQSSQRGGVYVGGAREWCGFSNCDGDWTGGAGAEIFQKE